VFERLHHLQRPTPWASSGFQDAYLLSPKSSAIHFTNTTRVPTCTRPYRSMMSLLCMRMQPADTKPPIEAGLLVPWMASGARWRGHEDYRGGGAMALPSHRLPAIKQHCIEMATASLVLLLIPVWRLKYDPLNFVGRCCSHIGMQQLTKGGSLRSSVVCGHHDW
jgi:hypothetical protein